MKFFIYPLLSLIFFFTFTTASSSFAAPRGGRGLEVIYPLFFSGNAGYGPEARSRPNGGCRPWPYSPTLEAEVRVEVKEIEGGVVIRLISEDEKTKKGLRLMGRMIRLMNDIKELEGEGR